MIAELENAACIATLRFTEGPLGARTARRLFVAPVVTVEDRTQATSQRLYAEADEAQAAARRKRAEDARKRRGSVVDERSGRHVNYADVVDTASTMDPRVVDRSHIRSGRHGNSVNHILKPDEEGGSLSPSRCS